MQSNDDLGYKPICDWDSVVYDDIRTLGAVVGAKSEGYAKNRRYRVYGYIHFNSRDGSRDCIEAECCGRGLSADAAIGQFRSNAKELGWKADRVNAICTTLSMQLEDLQDY